MFNWSFHVEMVFSHQLVSLYVEMIFSHVQLVFHVEMVFSIFSHVQMVITHVQLVFSYVEMVFSHVQLYLYLFVQRLPGSADGAEYSQVQLRGLFPVPMFCQCFATSLLLQERCLNMTTPSHAESFSFLASFILYTPPGVLFKMI